MKLLKIVKLISLACILSTVISCGNLIDDLSASKEDSDIFTRYNKMMSDLEKIKNATAGEKKLMAFQIEGRLKSYRTVETSYGEKCEEYVLYPNTYFVFPTVGQAMPNGTLYSSMVYYDINGKSPVDENDEKLPLLVTAKKLSEACGIDDTQIVEGGYKFSVDKFLEHYRNPAEGIDLKLVLQHPDPENPTELVRSAVSHKIIKVEKADISYKLEGKTASDSNFKEIVPTTIYANGIVGFDLPDGNYKFTVTASNNYGYKTETDPDTKQTYLVGPVAYGKINLTDKKGGYTNEIPELDSKSFESLDAAISKVYEFEINANKQEFQEIDFATALIGEKGNMTETIRVKCKQDVGQLKSVIKKGAFVGEVNNVSSFMPGTVIEYSLNLPAGTPYDIYYTTDGSEPAVLENGKPTGVSGTAVKYVASDFSSKTVETFVSECGVDGKVHIIARAVINETLWTEKIDKYIAVAVPTLSYELYKGTKDSLSEKVLSSNYDKLEPGTYTLEFKKPQAGTVGATGLVFGDYGKLTIKKYEGAFADSPSLSSSAEYEGNDYEFTIGDSTKQVSLEVNLVASASGSTELISPSLTFRGRRKFAAPEFRVSHYSATTHLYKWVNVEDASAPTAESRKTNSISVADSAVSKNEGKIQVPGATHMILTSDIASARFYYEWTTDNTEPAEPTDLSSEYTDAVEIPLNFNTAKKVWVKVIAKDGDLCTSVAENTFELIPDATAIIRANYRATSSVFVETISRDTSKTLYGKFQLGYYINDKVYDVIEAGLYTDDTYKTFAKAPDNVKLLDITSVSKAFYDDFGPLIRIPLIDGNFLIFDMRQIGLTTGQLKVYLSTSKIPYTGKDWKPCTSDDEIAMPYHSCSIPEHDGEPHIYDMYHAWTSQPVAVEEGKKVYFKIEIPEFASKVSSSLRELNDRDNDVWKLKARTASDYE